MSVSAFPVLDRVPLQWSLHSVSSGRQRPLLKAPAAVADPASLALDAAESDVALIVAASGYGKTVAMRRAAAAAGRDDTEFLDDLDESPDGEARLFEALKHGRRVVAALQAEGWIGLRKAFAGNPRIPPWRLRLIELLPWETPQVRSLIQGRRAGCEDPKSRLRLQSLAALTDAGRLADVFGDLPRCPLFLRLILDLVEHSGLPGERIGPARLARDWARLKLGGDDQMAAAASDSGRFRDEHRLLRDFFAAWAGTGTPVRFWTDALQAEGLSPNAHPAPQAHLRSSPVRRSGAGSRRFPRSRLPAVPPPDLEIRVTHRVESGSHRLQYILHSANGRVQFYHRPLPGPVMNGDPEAYGATLQKRIEALGQRIGPDGERFLPGEIRRELENLGRELYQTLFPPEMRAAYRLFRKSVRTLQIVSEEPWIPWEWIRPYDDADPKEIIDDDFLCLRFSFARWLTGRYPPAETVRVASLAIIEAGEVPDAPPLSCASEERRFLSELAACHEIGVRERPSATYPETVAQLAEGQIDLFHFIGHGRFDPERTETYGFLLADGRALRPLDLVGPIQTRLVATRPLVFFNACHAAQLGGASTGLDGWVPQWIRGCGCGALAGPQWSVKDRLALAFARAFYTRLERGRTFAEAMRAARRALRRIDPDHPSWLAFVLYAHPNGRLLLGSSHP